jgi:hypothetical protein
MARRLAQAVGGALHALVLGLLREDRAPRLRRAVYLHCLATDGAHEEQGDGELRFLAAPPPTPERMMAVLAQVHEVIRAADDDLDLDPALAACLQLSLAGPHLAHSAPTSGTSVEAVDWRPNPKGEGCPYRDR